MRTTARFSAARHTVQGAEAATWSVVISFFIGYALRPLLAPSPVSAPEQHDASRGVRELASEELEIAPSDLEIEDGVVRAVGAPDRSLTVQELVSPRRSQAVAYPRQVAMYLSRELTDSSLPKIGKEFGGRDHTTVIHATSKITRLIREDRSVYNLVQELTARIKQAR